MFGYIHDPAFALYATSGISDEDEHLLDEALEELAEADIGLAPVTATAWLGLFVLAVLYWA